MNIYQNNLDALRINQNDLYDYLCADIAPETDGVRIEAAKNGEPVVVLELPQNTEVCLNSRYNPSAEAKRYMQELISLPDEAVLVMYGFSNGQFAREFLQKNKKNNYCLVVEPDIRCFYQIIRSIDISDILCDSRLRLIVCGVNDEALGIWISSAIKSYNVKTNRHVAVPKYADVFPEKLDWMVTVLNERYDKQKIESNTILQAGALSVRNNFYNMRFFPGCRSEASLAGRFPKDMPAIVVSAGPSLTKNVHLLERAKGKAFIICTDSAINAVLATGTKPDMITAVDFAKPVGLFTAEGLNKIPFLADVDLNTEVLSYLKPESLFFSTSDEKTWMKLFEEAGSGIAAVETGGSVATSAIAHLVEWGFQKIILIGQDLAFTGNKIHVGDGDDVALDINDRDYEFVEGLNGEILPVQKDYFQYLRWIEELGGSNHDIEIIDATEGGSRKRNTTVMTFADAIDKYCTREYDIEEILEGAPRLFTGEDKWLITEYLTGLSERLSGFAQSFEQALVLCKKGREILVSGRYDVAELKRINQFITEVDDAYVNSDEILCVNKYIAQAEADMAEDMYIEEADEIAEAIRMYDKVGKYYRMLADAIPELVELIEEAKIQIEGD